MADFTKALPLILKNEGGYSNHKSDVGKETHCGVSRHYHPKWSGWKIIDSLKADPGFPKILEGNTELNGLVASFYKKEFWDRVKGDLIESQEIADYLFDLGVQFGVSDASKLIQFLVMPSKADCDGIIGKKSLAAINAHNVGELLPHLILVRLALYWSRVRKNKNLRDFLEGWISRSYIASGDFGEGILQFVQKEL